LPGGSNVNSSGIYNDTLSTTAGCDSIIITNLTVTPILTYSQNINICTGNSYTLPNGNTVSTSGIYIDTVTNSKGCDSVITTNLTVNTILTSSQNISICTGESYILPGGNSVSNAGIYIDTISSTGGCDSVVTTNLSTIAASTATINPTICSDTSYQLANGTIINTTGIYHDTLVATNGCDSIITINLTVNIIPNVTISPNITIVQGDSVNLSATGGGIYNWTPTTNLSSVNTDTTTAFPTQTTTYCVIITDNKGCTSSACVTITVSDLPCIAPDKFEIPNAFSPNGDNINDEFCLQGWTPCNEEFLVVIYNRWGQKVYESLNPNFCWNGKNQDAGAHLPDGQVFVYYIKAKYVGSDTTIEKKGNITLIK